VDPTRSDEPPIRGRTNGGTETEPHTGPRRPARESGWTRTPRVAVPGVRHL